MKVFGRTLLAFCTLPLLWCTIMAVVNRRTEVTEALPVHARTIALGDSHIGCSVDPKVLTGSENIALAAEPYLLSWLKLRHIIAHHRVDTVILGFAPHNLSDKDHRKFHDNGWATERLLKRLYPLTTIGEAVQLPLYKQTYARTLFMNYCTVPHPTHITYIGHYSGLGAKYHADSAATYARHFMEKDSTVAPISAYGIACLDSIVALTTRDHIALYLVGAPLHASYRRNVPAEYKTRYADLSVRYADEGVHVIDRTALFQGDSLFANSDHLNGRGARRFTRELLQILRPVPDSTVAH